jgi:transposase
MSYEINADYRQNFLFPPSIEDWINKEHPARFVRDFVDVFDIEEIGFKVSKGTDGRPRYSSNLLLKVYLYGYFQRVRTSRGLERLCCNDLGMIWLTGRNNPDHNTIWRFFDENKKAISSLFVKVTYVARENGLLGLVLHALDGTKIRAQVSDASGWHKKTLEQKLATLENGIKEIMRELEQSGEKDDGRYLLSEKLSDEQARMVGIKEALKKMESINRKHLNPIDKDARMTKCGKGSSFCYNAQAVVDEKSGMIVAEDVVNEEADNSMLTPMIGKVEETIGSRAEETVADAGYYSPDQMLKAEEKGYAVLVNINESISPEKEDVPFHKSKFVYDEKEDVFVCPLGENLFYERTAKDRRCKYQERIYRCKSFRYCPRRKDCSREKRGRKIAMGSHYGAVNRQLEKQKNPVKKEQLQRRGSIIERGFGFIKEFMGFRRFSVRGLEKVKTQWSLVCTTFNLYKLFRSWKIGKVAFA